MYFFRSFVHKMGYIAGILSLTLHIVPLSSSSLCSNAVINV